MLPFTIDDAVAAIVYASRRAGGLVYCRLGCHSDCCGGSDAAREIANSGWIARPFLSRGIVTRKSQTEKELSIEQPEKKRMHRCEVEVIVSGIVTS